MILSDFPRCSAYLAGARINVSDPSMTDYWYAALLADAKFTDAECERAGIDFGNGPSSGQDGTEILRKLEVMMASAPRKKPRPSVDMESLKAFFGSRGIKASKLESDEDFWSVAMTLWPNSIERPEQATLAGLHHQLRCMTKRQRKAATANLHRVDARFLARQAEAA